MENNSSLESGKKGSAKAPKAPLLALLSALASCGPRDVVEPVEAQIEDLPQDCSDLSPIGLPGGGRNALAPNLAIKHCPISQSAEANDPTRPAPSCGSKVVDGDGSTGTLRTHFKLDVFRVCQGPVRVSTVGTFSDGARKVLRGQQPMDRGGESSVDSKLEPGMTSFQLMGKDYFGNTITTNPPIAVVQ